MLYERLLSVMASKDSGVGVLYCESWLADHLNTFNNMKQFEHPIPNSSTSAQP